MCAARDRFVLHYEASASVGGKIARIGQRLVDLAAQKMAAEFFSNFETQLPVHPAARADIAIDEQAAEPRIWARLWNWLRPLAGRRPVEAADPGRAP